MPWEIPITVEDTTYPVRFNTEVEPTQADIDEAVAMIMQQRSTPSAPAADQPGRLGSFASNVGRGALSVIPGTVGGVGYALGSDTLTGAADTIEGGINRMLPVNPEYQDELLMKGGQAVGQAIGMLGTGGAVGAAGKSLALSRGLAQGAAAAKGANLAKNVMLGTGIAQGTRGGGQAAEQYGMQGGAAYARALLGGAIEGATERYLFGMGTELAPVKKFLGEAAEKGVGGIVKSAGTEAGEEAVSQIGGNVATSVLAPYGVQTPGVLEGVGESALLGGIAGGTIGGIGALMQPSPTIEGDALVPTEQAPPPVEEPEDDYGVAAFQQQMTEIAAQPDPIAPIQQTVTAAAENSVRVNANVLPATAAVIQAGGLAPAPTVEQPAPTTIATAPAPAPSDPAEILRKRNAEAKTFIAYDSEDLVDRKATREKREAAAKEAGMTRETWETEQAALNQKSKENFFAALNEGDTLEWTDLNGRKGTGIVEIGLDGKKVVRNTTEESPAEGYLYGPQAGIFGQFADSLKVTKYAPRRRAAPTVEQPAPVVEQPRTREGEIAQMRAMLRLNLSAEEREDMEQQLAQAQAEGAAADQTAEERRQAIQREDIIRRQQDREAELQRLAEERQRATAREQQRQQPPVVEETVAPIQPVPVVEETGAPQTEPAAEEAPDRLMDVPQAMQFLYGKGLTKTDREKAQKLIEKNEREARKTGKVSGGRAFYESEIDAAVEEVLAQKQTSSDFRRTLEQAKANKGTSQELSALVDALAVAEATLKEIESDRGMYGVQWAEKNVRRRATMQKAKIRDLKERIVAIAPSVKKAPSPSPAPEVTPEQVPNVENVIDEPGAAEVGSGMEELTIPETLRKKLTLPYAAVSVTDLEVIPASTWSRRRDYLEGKARLNAQEKQELQKTNKQNWNTYQYNENARINEVAASLRAAIQDMQLARPDLEAEFRAKAATQAEGTRTSQAERGTTSEIRATTADAGRTGGKLQQLPETLQRVGDKPESATSQPKTNKEQPVLLRSVQGLMLSEGEAAITGLFQEGESGLIDALARFRGESSAKGSTLEDITSTLDRVLEEWGADKKYRDSARKKMITLEDRFYSSEETPVEAPAPAPPVQRDVTKPEQMSFPSWFNQGKWQTEIRKNPPQVSAPTVNKSVKILTPTIDGVKEVRGKTYYLPGYKGPNLVVSTTKVRGKENYWVRLESGGLLLANGQGGDGGLDDVIKQAVQRIKNWTTQTGKTVWEMAYASEIALAMAQRKPVAAEAVDTYYDGKAPKGYVRQGDLYVFQPSGTVEAKPEPTPKEPEYISPKEIAERFAAESERNARRPSDTVAEMEAKEAAYKPQVRQSGAELLEEYKAQQKAKPAPEFTTIHPKTQEKFNTAFEAKDAGAMNSLLDPMNKGSRAEFERRTGVKLPTTQKGTRDSVETWAATIPVADLTDTELDRDLLRLGEYSKKTYASDALKARALELAKEFQKRQDVVATKPAETELAQVGDEVTWMAAGREARGTVYAVRGDSADIDYFGPKTVPLSELSIVRKSGRRLAQEKRDAEAAASTAQKKPQEPKQPKPKSKFTKAEVASLEQGKTPEGWTLSVGEPVTVTDTKGKTWRVKTQYSPTRTMTLVSGDEVQTFDVQTAPQPKPAAEVETTVAEVPATGKYSVYQAGGRWLIQQSDKRGFGDQIEESQEEAIKESLRQQDMERQNKEFYRKQEEKAAEAQRELEAKEKPLNDYLDTLGLTAMQRGKLKKTLQESEGRRSQKTGKTYFGGREQVTRDMVADGYTPTTKQVPAIKEPTGIQWNRMSEREQREYEKKKAAAGTKTEYRLEIGDGDSIFVVTKAEYDYANWLKSRKPTTSGFGSTNTVVTKEAKDQAAKSLRESLGQTNVGLNPATLKYAITVGTYYLEGGVRSFADFSAKMVEEFGEGVRKYLQPAYEALRKRTDIDTAGMDAEEGVETAPVAEAPTAPAAAPAARVEAETPKAAPTQAAPTQAAPKPAAVAESDVVGIANARVKAQRERLNLEELNALVGEAYSFPQMWADSESALKVDPTRGSALVKELNEKPRSLKPLEVAILLREEVVRTNALNQAMEEFNAAPSGNNEVERQRMDEAVVALTEVDNAAKVSGTEQGRALNARKLLAKLDYTLPKMLTTLSAANNGSLKDGDLEMVTRLQKRLKDVQDQLAEVESGQADRIAEAEKIAFEAGRQEVLKDIEERAKNEAERVAEMQKRKAEYLAAKKEAAKTPSKWEEIRAAARARNAELRSNLYSDVVLVKAASMAVNDVIIGATYIAEGVTKFADWVSKMRSEDINLTDDEMQQLFKESKAFDAGEDLPASEAPLKVKKAKAPAIDKVKAIAADEEALDSRTVYNLVVEKMKKRAEESKAAKLPEMGEKDLASVISEVTKDVQEFFPDITEREIRDLFSGYGKILMPSQDELAKQIRQLSALGKLQSAIEDAMQRRAPLKSGPQRDKATQAIRLQQKKLARELRMMGRDYEAGEEQLRSPLDAIKARLNNQIDDLAMEINTRKKAPRRPSVDYDKDTQELADLRDELKRISDFINAPAGPTFTELVNEEMKKIDARIAELQKTLAEGNFAKKEDELLHTAELDAKRAVRDALNNTLQKKRREAADKLRTQEDIDKEALEAVEEAITELNRKIEAEDYALPQRRTPTQTAQYEARVNEKKRLQQKVRDARANLFGRKGLTDEQRIKQATAAVDKSIERMQKMLTSGNYDVPKRTSKTPETPELAQKRETRDKLRKQLLELRKLKRDALIDPIAKQLKTDKKRIQTRMDKLKKRMETGDFSKPEKRKKATDDELLALQVEEENLKEAWAKMVFERQLASRGPGKRLLDAGQQTLNTARAVLTSFDVSAVLRQGGFIVLGNPLRGFRNLGPMFQAFGSDKFAKEEKFRLERRENFKNGAYQQSKLFLADVNKVDQMTQQEEAFMSRWIKKLPKGAKGLYIGSAIQGSQRAYTVFLNRLRMDTFDAMVANLKKGSEPTPQEMSAVANYINIATGRGDLGKFNQAGTMLNTVFFAPRLVASRFQILAGYPYFTASGRTKALVLREYGKFFAGATLVYVIGALAQGDDDEPIETDPRSSDFLKIRFGDTRVDPLSGLIQATVLVSRLVSGEKKQASGKIVPIRGEKVPYGADDSFDVMGNFVRTKFSPIVGSAVNVVTGKNVVGEPTDIGEETKRMLIPMSFTEMKETLEAQGVPEATALIMLQLFGMGVQTYTPGKK